MKLQSRKKLIYIFSIIVLAVSTAYFLFFRNSFEDFIVSETDSYIVVDKDILSLLTTEKDDFDKTFLKIQKGMLLSFEETINPNIINHSKSLFLFNPGIYTGTFNLKVFEMFEKEDDYWVLKDKYSLPFKNLNIIKDREKIYLRKYGTNYILGKNLYLMKFFHKEYEDKKLNYKLIKSYKSGFKTATDLSKTERFGLKLDVAQGKIEIKNNKVNFNYQISFLKESDFKNFYVNNKKTVGKYYNGEGLYFDINGLNPIAFLLFLYCIDYEKQTESIKNVNWKTIIDEAHSEFYFIPSKNAILMEHKDSEFMNFLFNIVTEKVDDAYILGNQKLYVEGNFLKVNHKFSTNKVNLIEPDVFLKGRISSKEFMGYFGVETKKLSTEYIDLEGIVKENYIEINVAVDEKSYKKQLSQ